MGNPGAKFEIVFPYVSYLIIYIIKQLKENLFLVT